MVGGGLSPKKAPPSPPARPEVGRHSLLPGKPPRLSEVGRHTVGPVGNTRRTWPHFPFFTLVIIRAEKHQRWECIPGSPDTLHMF